VQSSGRHAQLVLGEHRHPPAGEQHRDLVLVAGDTVRAVDQGTRIDLSATSQVGGYDMEDVQRDLLDSSAG